jgi:hypothetical protein
MNRKSLSGKLELEPTKKVLFPKIFYGLALMKVCQEQLQLGALLLERH